MNLVMMSHNLSKFYVQMTCNFFSMVFFYIRWKVGQPA